MKSHEDLHFLRVEDRDLAEQIHFALLGQGHTTFFDKEDLPPADDFHSRLREAVAQCDAFIYLISPESVSRSGYALTELGHARDKWPHPKGRVLPVLVRKVDFGAIPNYAKAVTILEPEGNVPAEVLRAVAPPFGVEESQPAGKIESSAAWKRPAVLALIAVVVAMVAVGIFIATRRPPTDEVTVSQTTPATQKPATKQSEARSGPALANAADLSYPLDDLWCTRGVAKNPIIARAAELAKSHYSVDLKRHLLLNQDQAPVSVVPASSLSDLQQARYLVVHFSAGPAKGVAAYFEQPDVNVSVHVMIARDGTVKQFVPFDYAAHHAGSSNWKGLSGLNQYSIGIDLENLGLLKRVDGKWKSALGQEVPDDEVALGKIPENGWHKYGDEQLRSFFQVACSLRHAYPALEDVLGHDEISPGRKLDPGPAFPMAQMRRRLFAGKPNGARLEQGVNAKS